MPAIRDYSQALTTTAGQFILVPMPANEPGDLLIAMMTSDTGTPTWNGLDPVTSAQYDDGGAFTDETTDSNSDTAADIFFVPAAPAFNDAFYVGAAAPFRSPWFQFSTQGAGTWTITWEYWNGGSWAALSGVTDNTTNFRAAVTIPVSVVYTMPTNWASTTVNSVSAYYIRGRVSAFTSITTRPVGTQVWIEDGWQTLTSTTNTANLAVLYKTATANEVDTTFRSSVSETQNGSIISVRDVDPWCDTKTYNAVQIDVVASAGTFTRTTGSFLTDGFTQGMAIVTSGFTNGGNNAYKIISSVTATVITVTSNSGLVNETGNGNERVTNWLFGSQTGFANANTSAATANMPTMTTDVDNCLVMWGAAHSAAAVPSILEGACQLIFGKDGQSHSDGCSWGWQASAGTTATVGYSNVSAAAARLGVWAIRPKGVGTPVIPGYTAADSSVYVSPFTGAAFSSDSATTNTITTTFTGTINGRPLAAGATTATSADTGINSYHAMSYCAGVTTPRSWAGTRTVIAARTTLASKNILFHHQPLLPVDIQTTDSVSLQGTMGRAIGLASTTSNFNVWHVGGAFTSWGTSRHAPAVINTDATTGIIQTTGSFNAASITVIGNMVSGKNVVPDWLIGSVWALDTTTICGGSSVEPLSIEGTVVAYSDGHERKSAIRQGFGQMMAFGPIQFGNGGTNPIYMEFDATAIEFPRQYNKDLREVFYNSVDNFAGITYYPGASDTLIHKNSVVSSPSRYKWGLHASASTSATYNFSGLQVIGAGTVTLNKAITLTGLTINDYSTLDVSGLTFNQGTILNMPATNDSVTTSNSTVISNSSITTTTVTAGNRWASVATADLDIFSGNTFTGSHTSGHAVRLSSTGSVTLSSNTWTSYGPAAFGFHTQTDVDPAADTITKASHGYSTGDPVYYQDQGGSDTVGLTDGNLYYVRADSASLLGFFSSSADAVANTNRVALSDGAAGQTHYIYSAGAAIYNNSGGAVTINLTNTSSVPSIRNSDSSSTNVILSVTVSLAVVDGSNNPVEGVQVYFQKSAAGKSWNYTSDAGNSAGDADFVVNETVDLDIPQTGWIHVWDASSNTKQNYRYASWSGSTFTLNAQVTGNATSTGSGTSLISTSTNFLTADIEEGDTIRNTTDGSWAIVDEVVDADNITTSPLQGGTDNTWQSSDAFSIHRLAINYTDTEDRVDVPIFNGQTDVNGDISTTYNYSAYSTNLPVIIRVRSNEGATKYVPYTTSGTITSTGYSGTVVLTEDSVAT